MSAATICREHRVRLLLALLMHPVHPRPTARVLLHMMRCETCGDPATDTFGPAVRWYNPFRVATWRDDAGWTAKYSLADGFHEAQGFPTRRKARAELRKAMTICGARINGEWREVRA